MIYCVSVSWGTYNFLSQFGGGGVGRTRIWEQSCFVESQPESVSHSLFRAAPRPVRAPVAWQPAVNKGWSRAQRMFQPCSLQYLIRKYKLFQAQNYTHREQKQHQSCSSFNCQDFITSSTFINFRLSPLRLKRTCPNPKLRARGIIFTFTGSPTKVGPSLTNC